MLCVVCDLQHLRSNELIDYTQLGMAYQLQAAEVLHNRALCKARLNDPNGARADLAVAQELKSTKEHDRIDEAMRSLVRTQYPAIFILSRSSTHTLPA